MKQSLQLRLSQQLVMTPQLQQAIRLLQLSRLDLQTEIQTALDSNVMLEHLDDAAQDVPSLAASSSGTTESAPERPEREQETPVESVWGDVAELSLYSGGGGGSAGQGEDDDWDPHEQYITEPETLREHLLMQMRLTPLDDQQAAIATAIIDAIDENGYLTLNLEEICHSLAPTMTVTADTVEAVLRQVQKFDPQGVGARTPSECLLLQLDALPEQTPYLAEARALVEQHLGLLAGRDYTVLMRRLKLTREGLQAVIQLIQTLQPHPGEHHAHNAAPYVVPDVIVTRRAGVWRVELHPDSLPKIRINPHYAALARNVQTAATTNGHSAVCLKTHLQEARWFIKSLQNRNETLLRVATCIVEHQRAFLEQGEEHMKPLVLRDIADALGMHESTVSRVTTQKYLHTPRGVFELKYFFSSHVGSEDGDAYSSTAIRAMIRKLIQAEDPRRPLSDDKIARKLNAEGIQVARRTVAKYREAMAVPSSSERRSLL